MTCLLYVYVFAVCTCRVCVIPAHFYCDLTRLYEQLGPQSSQQNIYEDLDISKGKYMFSSHSFKRRVITVRQSYQCNAIQYKTIHNPVYLKGVNYIPSIKLGEFVGCYRSEIDLHYEEV